MQWCRVIPEAMDPAVRYMDLRTETLSIFEKVGSFLADLCDGSGRHQDTAEASSLDSNLGSFYETFSRLQARHGDQTLTVAVLALTKSGKLIQPLHPDLVPLHESSFRNLLVSRSLLSETRR